MGFRLFFVFILISGCSFFSKDDEMIRVGEISFSESYFADRLVEKLKNVDGLHIKNRDLIASLSHQLERELIEEGFFFLWAKKKNIKIERSDLAAFIGSRGTTSAGLPTDFIFEAAPAQNLLENHLRLQIIKNHLLADLETKVEVTESELMDAYKKKSPFLSPALVRAQQILLATEEDARAVLRKIQAGSSFEEMARKFSLSPEGASGGALGWIDARTSAQAKWLTQQPRGLIDRVSPGPGGFYIFKVLESKKSAVQSYSEVKDLLKKTIIEQKRNEAYLHWLEEQVKTTKVFSNETLLQTITSHYQETL